MARQKTQIIITTTNTVWYVFQWTFENMNSLKQKQTTYK